MELLKFAAKRPLIERLGEGVDKHWVAYVDDRDAFYRIIEKGGMFIADLVIDDPARMPDKRVIEPVSHTEDLATAVTVCNEHNRQRLNPTKRITTDIPDDLLAEYQRWAFKEDTTVMELIVRAMRAGLIMSRNSST